MPFKRLKGGVTAPKGFTAAGMHAGIKPAPQLDLALIASSHPASMAAVFTKSRLPAAPVIVNRRKLKQPVGRAIIINSGNANACTGSQGLTDATHMASLVAQELQIEPKTVYVGSTGLIGQPLPLAKIRKAVPSLAHRIRRSGHREAAKAIMTTDTFHKETALQTTIGQTPIRVGGMAKGSGMIHPDMATMLAYITTDACMTPQAFQHALRSAVDLSFNRISVDGDTSTNDTVMGMANGLAGNPQLTLKSPGYQAFQTLLNRVCLSLALEIGKDGEGRTKLVKICVTGAKTDRHAKRIAQTIATSPLVKTALFGADPNWGRIMAAIGRAGVPVSAHSIRLDFNGVPVVKDGKGLGASYQKRAQDIMQREEFQITASLGIGSGSYYLWTTDLTYEYVKINTAYPT